MDFATGFRDLEVYKLSRQLSKEIFEVSKNFPPEEMYSLTDQIRRSSRSVGGQIAEAWGKRQYTQYFTRKLMEADGEQLETQHWIETAQDCSYISKTFADRLLQRYASVEKMLHAMIHKADSFGRK